MSGVITFMYISYMCLTYNIYICTYIHISLYNLSMEVRGRLWFGSDRSRFPLDFWQENGDGGCSGKIVVFFFNPPLNTFLNLPDFLKVPKASVKLLACHFLNCQWKPSAYCEIAKYWLFFVGKKYNISWTPCKRLCVCSIWISTHTGRTAKVICSGKNMGK